MGDPAGNITLADDHGNAVTVPADQAADLVTRGYHVEGGAASANRITHEARKDFYSGPANTAATFGANVFSGASLGLTDVAAAALGYGDDLKGLNEFNPGTAAVGKVTGAVAGAFVAPESLLAKTPAGLTARLGARIAEAGEGASGLTRAAYTAGAGVTEGALQNAGSYVSDVALGDRDLSAEGFVGAMGKGALYGGVASGALSLASNGVIAARRLIPLADQTPEAMIAAEAGARRAVSDSVQTSKGLEATGANAVTRADQETQQFLTDLEAERASAMRDAGVAPRPVAETAGPAGETQVSQTSSAVPESTPFEPTPGEPSAPRPKPGKQGPEAKRLLKDWRAKYADGAVDYDAANAAARRDRLAKWAEGFEAKTPEDEAIKAYFQHDQDPIRVLDENLKPMRLGMPEEAPAAVKAVANKAAGEAAHEAYLAAVPVAADISENGTELMARAMYAGRREAARAMDDVYTAYKAGQPIVDIRAAATQKLTGQLHELAEARNDLLHSLAASPEADSLLEKLKGTAQAVNETGKLPTLGERILSGAPTTPAAIDPDAAVAKALGKSKDVNEDIASIAPKITRYEAAKATLTESLGPKASADAQAHAAAFRAAQEKAESASARQVAQATENIDKAAAGAPLEKMVGGSKPALGGLMKHASDAGAAYEALREMGVPLPDPKGIPVIGPILSMYLKAKILKKMAGKFGGSFAATAEGTIAAKASTTRNRIASAVDSLASAAGPVAAAASRAGGPAAALGHKLFESQDDAKPYTSDPKIEPIEKMYQTRMAELGAAMKPGAIEQAVRARIHTSDPTIVDAIVAAETRRLTYLFAQAPKPDAMPLPGQPVRLPSKTEISSWGVTLSAAHDPAAVFERVAAGGVARPAEIDCINNCYPQLVAEAQARLVDRLSKADAPAPYMRRVAASALVGIPLDSSAIPENAAYLQSGFSKPAAQAPQPMPHPTLAANISTGQHSLTRLDR